MVCDFGIWEILLQAIDGFFGRFKWKCAEYMFFRWPSTHCCFGHLTSGLLELYSSFGRRYVSLMIRISLRGYYTYLVGR